MPCASACASLPPARAEIQSRSPWKARSFCKSRSTSCSSNTDNSGRPSHGAACADWSPTAGTSNLPFDEWTSIFGSERLTGALLDSPHSPRPHSRNERRELQAGPEQAPLQTLPTRYVVQRNAGKLTFQEKATCSRRRATARIAATRMIARCALSPSSPAPTARRYAATGLDRSARPSKSASRAANDYLRRRQSRSMMHFYSGRPMQIYSGVDSVYATPRKGPTLSALPLCIGVRDWPPTESLPPKLNRPRSGCYLVANSNRLIGDVGSYLEYVCDIRCLLARPKRFELLTPRFVVWWRHVADLSRQSAIKGRSLLRPAERTGFRLRTERYCARFRALVTL